MRQIFTILRREYLERVRRRSFLIGTVLGPVFLLGVTFVPIWLSGKSSGRTVHLVAVDRTEALQGKIEQAFPDTLPDGSARYVFDWHQPPFESAIDYLDSGLSQQLLDGIFTGLLWLSANALEDGEAELYAQGLADPEVLGRLRSALGRAAMIHRLEERGITAEETDAISRRIPLHTFKVSEKGVREQGFEVDFMTAFIFAMILYMTILLYGISVQRSVLEDKNSRIVEIILSAARPFQLMLGKIIGVGGVGLTQYAIWSLVLILVGVYVKGTDPGLASVTNLPALTLFFFVVYFILGYLIFAAIYASIGAIVNTDQEAQQMQWPVTSLLIIPIILMQMVIKDPDSSMSVILSLVPFFTPILMMMRINLSSPPAWQLALSVVLMLGTILVLAAVAARIFRVGILMYGKRPTLPEIVRWIREA